jgi:putative aldouronate transport system permease protein
MIARKRYRISAFTVINASILICLAALCLMPLIHTLAVSFSARAKVLAGQVTFWPKGVNLHSYRWVLKQVGFWTAMVVSVKRMVLGIGVNLVLVLLAAYPLSKESTEFRARTFYAWFLFFTMLFSGGLIPLYITVATVGLLDTIWALVLPSGVQVFLVLLMLNFFRQVPKELQDAAEIDGAGKFRVLWQIYVPASLPAIATITLFSGVFHWNSWFDGLIYANQPANYPVQTYLQVLLRSDIRSQITSLSEIGEIFHLSNRTVRSAYVIIAIIPILSFYPFLQRYFIKGIVIGSVKG